MNNFVKNLILTVFYVFFLVVGIRSIMLNSIEDFLFGIFFLGLFTYPIIADLMECEKKDSEKHGKD